MCERDRAVPSSEPAKWQRQSLLFPQGDDLPLFSGTPQQVTERPFEPQDHTLKQAMLPEMPGIDYDAVLKRDKALRIRRVRKTSDTDTERQF